MTNELDLGGPIPRGRILLEASAGTGKTYALTALIVRSLADGLVDINEVLVVTFTRSAAREILDRVRAGIEEAATALRGPADNVPSWVLPLLDGDEHALSARHDRLRAASIDLDAAVVTTIHGFCRHALRLLGSKSPLSHGSTVSESASNAHAQTVRDLLIAALVDQPGALDPAGGDTNPARIEMAMAEVVKRALQNRGATVVPDPTWTADDGLAGGALQWAELARRATAEVVRRRIASGELDHDDLLTLLHEALHDVDSGPATARGLRSRFPMVFIDEFQDTDTVQWEIFERAFIAEPEKLGAASDLFVVGDPKQGIYRFRGADIEAYLAASGGADTRYDLTVNHRSDGHLIDIFNELCRGATFGDARIRYIEVQQSADTPANTMGLPAVSIRWMPPHPELRNKPTAAFVDADRSKAIVLEDLADEVTRLLAEPLKDGGPRIQPGHIAVIIRAHADADAVTEVLTRRGIPAIQTRVGSVVDSYMTDHLRLLINGMRRPSDLGAVKAVSVSCFVGLSATDLGSDDEIHQLQERLATWSDLMTRNGVHALVQSLRADPSVLSALVRDGDGARRLTDLDHLAELLHIGCEGRPAAPATVLRVLHALIAEAADAEAAGDEVRRRIASDAEAVQIMTVHGSKGLEFPIVLLPIPAKRRSGNQPYVYRVGERRYVDGAPRHKWISGDPDHDRRKATADRAADGDEQRLLYVALTRAEHRVVVWWRPTSGIGAAGLTRILFGSRDEQNAVDTTVEARLPDESGMRAHLAELVHRTDGLLDVQELPAVSVPLAPVTVPGGTPQTGRHATVDTTHFVDRDWRTWSFSSVSSDRRIEDPPPPRGGGDEPVGVTEPVRAGTTDLAAMPAGREIGQHLHNVLEAVDFRSTDLHSDVQRRLGRSMLLEGLDHGLIADGLVTAMSTPLAPLSDTRLVEIGRSDRLDELKFDLRLANAHGRVRMADLCRSVAEASPDDPYAAYFSDLADRIGGLQVSGHLIGFIDAVLRIPGDDGPRFVVVDYKSNRLHRQGDPDWLENYTAEAMQSAMVSHDYPLQAFLYSVALHRYLRWRLGRSYDPSAHLAGSTYLFLRGMVGQIDSDGRALGVSIWEPPIEAILTADRILAGAR